MRSSRSDLLCAGVVWSVMLISPWTRNATRALLHGGDRFDFDQLIGVTEESDSQQRACCRRERRGLHDVPNRYELGAIGGGNVNRRLQHVIRAGPSDGELRYQVFQCLLCLP